jgi:hypothetical protein
MLSELRLVDRIERIHGDRPYCDCGRETITVYRAGAMWLECAILNEPVEGRIQRLWNAVTAPGHVHELIANVPAPETLAA